MQHFVGLDVSVKETAICVVDEQGRVVARATVQSEPAAIAAWLLGLGLRFGRVGLEAGPMSPWIYAGLVEADLPAVCVETRHMHAALSARINKTDRNDAHGIAQMMRVGLFKAVHVKTPASQQRRLLLTSRKLLQHKVQDLENDLRGSLRNFGLKVGNVGKGETEETGAAASLTARLRWLRPTPLIPTWWRPTRRPRREARAPRDPSSAQGTSE